MNYDNNINLVVIGPGSCGKSTLYNLYMDIEQEDSEYINYSLGYKTASKTIQLTRDKRLTVTLFDVPNLEDPLSITKGMCNNVEGFILVFSIADRNSFDSIPSWISRIQECGGEFIILVGNKNDLESERTVSKGEAEVLAQQNKIKYYEVSGKKNTNVDRTFLEFINDIGNGGEKEVIPMPITKISKAADGHVAEGSVSGGNNQPSVPVSKTKIEILKCIFVGYSRVGKTSLLFSYADQRNFKASSGSVKEIIFKQKTIRAFNQEVILEIYDFPGSFNLEKYLAYVSEAVIIYFIYNVCNKESFKKVKQYFKEIVDTRRHKLSLMCLFGDKSDLPKKREVTIKKGEDFAYLNSIPFIEVSCLNNNEILDKAFQIHVAGYLARIRERKRIEDESKKNFK